MSSKTRKASRRTRKAGEVSREHGRQLEALACQGTSLPPVEDLKEELAELYKKASRITGPDTRSPNALAEAENTACVLADLQDRNDPCGRILDGETLDKILSVEAGSIHWEITGAESGVLNTTTLPCPSEAKENLWRDVTDAIPIPRKTECFPDLSPQTTTGTTDPVTRACLPEEVASAAYSQAAHGDMQAAEDIANPETQPDPREGDTGIRFGKLGCEDEGNPSSEASDEDSGESESVWKSQHGGYIRETVRVPKAVSDELEAVLDEVPIGQYRPVLRHLLAHIWACQMEMPSRYGNGVPIYYERIKDLCHHHDVKVPVRTQDVWEEAREAGVLWTSSYNREYGRCRIFRLTDEVTRRLEEVLKDSRDVKTRYNLVDGSRVYSAFTTDLTRKDGHSWQDTSEPLYRALKALKQTRDLVNKEAVEEHLDRLEAEKVAARKRYEQLAAEVERVESEILEEGKELTGEEKERLEEVREPAYEAAREKDRAESRYRQDRRIWDNITDQGLEEVDDMPEGVYQYDPAYEVQLASGRKTCLCGLQNASEEMKAAAAEGIPGYKNKDIKSSQTEALIQEMEIAEERGAPIDATPIKEYAESDGKDGLAEEYGIGRNRWKRPEHSVKFGAGFNHETYAAAKAAAEGRVLARIEGEDGEPDFSKLYRFKHESGKLAYERAVYGEMPTMATVARDWADDEDIEYDDPEDIYTILRDSYGEMADELDAWRDWLVDEFWSEACQSGGRGVGAFVRNACDLPFSIYSSCLAEGDREEPNRYEQKAGFATSRLQGLEAAYIDALTILSADYDYEVLRNEHDGLVVLGEIPDEARGKAGEMSGFHRAELEEKPFEGYGDVSKTNSAEDQPCDTTKSKAQSRQTPQARRSRSRTSQSNENSGGGSADGTADHGGARNGRTQSGSRRASHERSENTSGTTCRDTAPSGSSAVSPDTSGSRTSSGGNIGSTSPPN